VRLSDEMIVVWCAASIQGCSSTKGVAVQNVLDLSLVIIVEQPRHRSCHFLEAG
jgi:hypothetical protein